MPRVETLAEKVPRHCGAAHPDAAELEKLSHMLSEDLERHMYEIAGKTRGIAS
jgi:iron-sulfur cluster repair protein YtfE (RIC family)